MATSLTKKQMQQLRERDRNTCAWSGLESDRLVPQHRAGRGMGGDRSKNRASNVVLLDSLINGQIESDPVMQAEAVKRGIKISKWADPRMIPVQHAVHGEVFLTDDWRTVEVWDDPVF